MDTLITLIHRIVPTDEAQDLVEYALLVGLIAIVSAVMITQVGQTVGNVFWGVIANGV